MNCVYEIMQLTVNAGYGIKHACIRMCHPGNADGELAMLLRSHGPADAGEPIEKADEFMDSSTSLMRHVLAQGIFGLLVGYFLLHPISMFIFRWLDPRLAVTEHSMDLSVAPSPLVHSFTFQMVPMGIVFGLVGAAASAIDGYRRGIIARQRDYLRKQNQQLTRLELANRRTARFMAHDFKTHLGCISEFTDHLLETRRTIFDSQVIEILTRIRRQSHLMFGAVMDLLAFGQLQDNGEVRKQQIRLSEILQNVIEDLSLPDHADRLVLGEKNASCPAVHADPRILDRVLVNLVSNAFKHNPNGTRVVLDAEVVADEILVSCSDNGRGMPTDLAGSLFQEHGVLRDTPYKHSTGLGLAFCRTAVEAHGGRIWCETTPLQGTHVYFTLPI